MAETQLSVARQILDLTETMNEALTHMQERKAQGHPPRQTIQLIADVVHAFAEIQDAMATAFQHEREDGRYIAATSSFQEGLALMTNFYEGGGEEVVLDILGDAVVPRFAEWRGALERLLLPHVSS